MVAPRQRINAAAHVSSKRDPRESAATEPGARTATEPVAWTATGTGGRTAAGPSVGTGAEIAEPVTPFPRRSVIEELYQQGSARIRFPHALPGNVDTVLRISPVVSHAPLQAVLLNTAGGLTGKDEIHWSGTARADSRLTITTAACEKLYRTHGPQARQDTTLRIENGARIDWLPQETIIFDGAALKRSLTVHLAADATALLVESFVLGRRAMQECVNTLNLEDQWRIFRDDRLLHAEALRLEFNRRSDAQQQSMLHQYSAIATVLLVAPCSLETLTLLAERIRQLIPHDRLPLTAAASAMDHRLVIRVLANDGLSLRQFLIPCIEQLNDGIAIPQVWNV